MLDGIDYLMVNMDLIIGHSIPVACDRGAAASGSEQQDHYFAQNINLSEGQNALKSLN